MQTKKRLTKFMQLKEIHIGPQGTNTQPRSPSRGCNAIVEAVGRINRRYKTHLHDSRAAAVREAEAVISIGPVRRSFGKPTLILSGELSPAKYSDQIRRFLAETKVRSVAFALTNNQSYWGIHKTIFRAFDWSQKDYSTFSDEDKQTVRRLYEEGWTQPELAQKYGVSQPAITYLVTGYPDAKRFSSLRKKGHVTITSLVTETGTYFGEAIAKAEQLGITFHKVGPMLSFIDRADAKRLRAALRRRAAARERRLEEGFTYVVDPDIPGWGTKKVCLSGTRKRKANGRR